MKRTLVLSIVYLVTVGATRGWADGADPAVPRDNVIDPRLTVRQKAETFDALVKKVRPRFVWNDCDMLWIEHDGAGKPTFAMNRAYRLRVGGHEAYYLFEATRDFISKDNIDYTRRADATPKIIARDPRRGVVYRAVWISPTYDGTGHVQMSRQLFLFCDGQHRWHYIGEGPEEGDGRNSPSEYWSKRVESSVRWTDDPAAPVEVTTTQIRTSELLVGDGVNPASGPLDVRRDAVLGGSMPASLRWSESEYVVVGDKGEMRDALVHRVAYWSTGDDPRRKRLGELLVSEQLREWNPTLPDAIPAGTVVWLRGNLWKILESELAARPATRAASGELQPGRK